MKTKKDYCDSCAKEQFCKESSLLVNLSFVLDKPTGISTYATNLFPYLQSLGPTLLASKNYPDYQCYPIPNNLTPAQGRMGHLRRLFWTQFQLPKIYKELQSRLIFSPVPEMPIYSKCRSVIMVHDLIPLRFPKPTSPLTLYFRSILPQVLQQAACIICNSTATARDITDFFSVSAAKIQPIPLAYNRDRFFPISTTSKTSTTSSQPYFLYIGRQDPYKNLHRLIESFALIKNNNCSDCQLWLAGAKDPRFTPQLQQQVVELDLTERVKFLDYVSYEELPRIIGQAIALVFPSLWEGFGLPVLEAMACGTPVITSNLSSLPEVAGDAALLVDPYNQEEIAAAMEAVVVEGGLRDRLCTLSIARASQFSWAKTGEETVAVLKEYL